MPREPHPWLYAVSDAPHGGVGGEGVLDLSASIAPLGPSRLAIEAARAAPIDRYPSRRAGALVRAVAAELEVDEARVVAGPGAADLLLRVALAHLSPGDTAVPGWSPGAHSLRPDSPSTSTPWPLSAVQTTPRWASSPVPQTPPASPSPAS
jgi:hypothetical protein